MHSAIVHDWLVSSVGGGEKVLEAIHRLFPSPIHTLVHNKQKLKGSYFDSLDLKSSFIQKLPKAEQSYRNYLPLFPMAIEQFDLSEYDLVLSSSHCVAKGVLVHPQQLHICYCHTPVRYAWDLMHQYLKEAGLETGIKGAFVKWILHYIRGWDVHSSNRVDHFIANSKYVAGRIKRFYNRESKVIYPPINLSLFEMKESKEKFYLTASRLIPYKKIDLIVETFSKMPDQKLIVIGDGPEKKKIKEKAGANIEFLGYQSDQVLKEYLQKAKGFIFAALEDFGILPVEAMACGTPVIAFGQGGVRETVVNKKTGLFFAEQSSDAIRQAIETFETMEFDPQECRKQAQKFSHEHFSKQFRSYVLEKYSEFKNRECE